MQLFYSVLTLAVRAFHGEHDFCNRLVILSATVSWDCFQIPSVCPQSSSISACIHQYSLSLSLSLSLPPSLSLSGALLLNCERALAVYTGKRTASQREPCVTRFPQTTTVEKHTRRRDGSNTPCFLPPKTAPKTETALSATSGYL